MKYSKLARAQIINRMSNGKVSFENLPEELRDDEKIVLNAIKKSSVYFFYVSERLKNDRNFLLNIIQKNANALKHFPASYKDDKELVLLAVRKNEFTLQYASERLQNDKELLELLKNHEFDVYHFNQKINNKKWYEERMEFLSNIREKEIMEGSINSSDKFSKKLKF